MLLDFLSEVKDFRRAQGRKFDIGHILYLSTLAILSGAHSYRKIYQFIKNLVSDLVGAGKNANFKPALFDTQNGQQEIIYLIEDLGNGEFTALFPMAPTGFAGPVKIITKDRIIPLEASLGEVNLVMNHMGLGAGRLLKKDSQ